MKTLFVGINAKYIHSNLAIRSIASYAKTHHKLSIETREFTINHQADFILSELYQEKPDVIGFSCYIWNIELVKELITEIKKVLPRIKIIFGGPEVSYNPKELLAQLDIDFIVCGEGEKTVSELILAIEAQKDVHKIKGLCYQIEQDVQMNPPQDLLALDDIPFVYSDLTEFENRIIYYESSRGCPFGCSYCLSSIERGVRFLSLERTFEDLLFFLNNKVRQVKLVDRTFNCDKKRTLQLIQFIHKHDNGYTNFHFEISADLLTDELIIFLKQVRKGLFQFEIGVQSTNPTTLQHINRSCDLTKLFDVVARLKENQTVHLHLDLIAGLPHEDYQRFKQSFNDVYAIKPDQLQLGFLKLLKGSGMFDKRVEYDILCHSLPPFEVLSTHVLSYDDVLRLKLIEEMVEIYYNSTRYAHAIDYLQQFFATPFDFYEALAAFYQRNELHHCSHSKLGYYDILYRFLKTLVGYDDIMFQWLVKLDMLLHEKVKKLPDWVTVNLNLDYRTKILAFYEQNTATDFLVEYGTSDEKQLYKVSHLEVFPFHPFTKEPVETAVLFNYKRRDILERAASLVVEIG